MTNKQTNRQTDKPTRTDSKILPTPTDIVGVGKNTERVKKPSDVVDSWTVLVIVTCLDVDEHAVYILSLIHI